MRTCLGSIIAFCVLSLVGLARPVQPPRFEWRETPGRSLTLLFKGETLWQFNFAKEEGKPYFHPVHATDGALLTWLRPADHTWHRGIWFSWKLINKVNYWEENKQGLAEGQTEITSINIKRSPGYAAAFKLELTYHLSDQPPLLREQRTITVTPPDDQGAYRMDWHMTWTAADKEVLLDRTKPPGQGGPSYGGYAGLTYRAAQAMTDYQVLDSEGRRDREGHGKTGRWLDFSAVPGAGKQPVGVTLFDHPSNPRHPTPWFVDTNAPKKYGFVGAAPLFHDTLTLRPGEKLELRYRVLIHNGRPDMKRLEEEFKQFGKGEQGTGGI